MPFRKLSIPPYHSPFSHKPGIWGWIPGSCVVGRFFPTAVELYVPTHDGYDLRRRLLLQENGPVEAWTVRFDAVHCKVIVEGKTSQGFFRYAVESESETIFFHAAKRSMSVLVEEQAYVVPKAAKISLLPCSVPSRPFPLPRLLLGCHKSPLWERIVRSPDMAEVLPLWYQVSCPCPLESSHSLLGDIAEAIEKKDSRTVLAGFQRFFSAGISDFFVPKSQDDCYLGYDRPLLPPNVCLKDVNGMVLSAIRALFIQEQKDHIFFLPCLPKEFISGRMLRERMRGHLVDLEWRKGQIRRVGIEASHDDVVTLCTSFSMSCRLRAILGRTSTTYCTKQPLELKRGEQYLLDNFSSC